MAIHASRDTTTGLEFEKQVSCKEDGIDLTKYNLWRFIDSLGIRWQDIVSSKKLPDEAYWNPKTKTLTIYEKKYQQTPGSADEKLETAAYKLLYFQKIGAIIGAKIVTYNYKLSSWFKQSKYKDVLDYIDSIPGCSYVFVEE